jgi:hypothetical protein
MCGALAGACNRDPAGECSTKISPGRQRHGIGPVWQLRQRKGLERPGASCCLRCRHHVCYRRLRWSCCCFCVAFLHKRQRHYLNSTHRYTRRCQH